ncbi:hypothetical protein LTS15_009718 [Exophiala xenobiotica]|nr:hypothetical protein LTS15_009718 [Exophiala xenobiotica]
MWVLNKFRVGTMLTIRLQMGNASIPYLLGTELPNSALREKTRALGAAWNVVWAFVTNFTIPVVHSRRLTPFSRSVPFDPFRKMPIHLTDTKLSVGQLEGDKQVEMTGSDNFEYPSPK